MTYFTSVDAIRVFLAYKTRAFIIFYGAFRISDEKFKTIDFIGPHCCHNQFKRFPRSLNCWIWRISIRFRVSYDKMSCFASFTKTTS